MSIIVQQDATIYSLLYFCKLLYMYRVVTPPIIRAHITVITASGTGQTVSANFRYRGAVGTAVPAVGRLLTLIHDARTHEHKINLRRSIGRTIDRDSVSPPYFFVIQQQRWCRARKISRVIDFRSVAKIRHGCNMSKNFLYSGSFCVLFDDTLCC